VAGATDPGPRGGARHAVCGATRGRD